MHDRIIHSMENKTAKLLEINFSGNLCNLGLYQQKYLSYGTKNAINKRKKDKRNFNKNKKFCSSKNIVMRMQS
jgi:hypothetical protein